MPNTREKLIELLEQAPGHANWEIFSFDDIADYLIDNGVTIQNQAIDFDYGAED